MDNTEVHHHNAVYVGQSAVLHYFPPLLLATAALPLLVGAPYAALALAAPAFLANLILPWRFAITDSGIGLWFAFGKYRFLDKDRVTVHFRNGSPVLFQRTRAPFGYGLSDPHAQQDPAALRAILSEHGFHLTG